MPSIAGLVGITVDCQDVPLVAAFWAAVLDAEPRTDDDLPGWLRITPPVPSGLVLTFQPVAEPKSGKVRLHLDLLTDDLDAARAAVAGLGGAETGERHEYDACTVQVMTDPEGHEFCLMQYAVDA